MAGAISQVVSTNNRCGQWSASVKRGLRHPSIVRGMTERIRRKRLTAAQSSMCRLLYSKSVTRHDTASEVPNVYICFFLKEC